MKRCDGVSIMRLADSRACGSQSSRRDLRWWPTQARRQQQLGRTSKCWVEEESEAFVQKLMDPPDKQNENKRKEQVIQANL